MQTTVFPPSMDQDPFPNSAVMVEQVLMELIENFNRMVESLHERNLKREAQLETLTRELSLEREQRRELEAKLSAYQNGTNQIAEGMKAQVHQTHPPPQPQHHPPPPPPPQQQPQHPQTQVIYQPIPPQQNQYIWTYDTSTSNGAGYYNHYAPAFDQQQQ